MHLPYPAEQVSTDISLECPANKTALLPVAKTEDIDLGEFKIRVFYPKTSSSSPPPVFIWYHGGGMVLGNINSENGFCTRVCNAAQCVVVAVDYRLAPEHAFPAGHDDAWKGKPITDSLSRSSLIVAFTWVYESGRAKLGVDVTRFGVGGSSSGGNLAAYVTQQAGLEGKKIDFVGCYRDVELITGCAVGSSYRQHCYRPDLQLME